MKDSDPLQLICPLYWLLDAGYLWHHTIYNHLTKDLKLRKANLDISLYIKNTNETDHVPGLVGQYVDGSLIVDDEKFEQEIQKLLKDLTVNRENTFHLDLLELKYHGKETKLYLINSNTFFN